MLFKPLSTATFFSWTKKEFSFLKYLLRLTKILLWSCLLWNMFVLENKPAFLFLQEKMSFSTSTCPKIACCLVNFRTREKSYCGCLSGDPSLTFCWALAEGGFSCLAPSRHYGLINFGGAVWSCTYEVKETSIALNLATGCCVSSC